jgi:hypothetical protein
VAGVVEVEVGDLPGDGDLELPCLGEGQRRRCEGGEDRAEHGGELGLGLKIKGRLGFETRDKTDKEAYERRGIVRAEDDEIQQQQQRNETSAVLIAVVLERFS